MLIAPLRGVDEVARPVAQCAVGSRRQRPHRRVRSIFSADCQAAGEQANAESCDEPVRLMMSAHEILLRFWMKENSAPWLDQTPEQNGDKTGEFLRRILTFILMTWDICKY